MTPDIVRNDTDRRRNVVPWTTAHAIQDERAARFVSRPQAEGSCLICYPVGGCVPQSGEFAPGAFVTCVKPVPSTLTV